MNDFSILLTLGVSRKAVEIDTIKRNVWFLRRFRGVHNTDIVIYSEYFCAFLSEKNFQLLCCIEVYIL